MNKLISDSACAIDYEAEYYRAMDELSKAKIENEQFRKQLDDMTRENAVLASQLKIVRLIFSGKEY